jgi:hypothetical protein
MALPFDYSGEISSGSILAGSVESFQQTFLTKLKERLEKSDISFQVTDNEILVKPTSKAKLFSADAVLVSSVGNLRFILDDEEGTLSYHISFTKWLIYYSIVFFVVFGSFLIAVAHGHLMAKLGVLLLLWLLLIVAVINTSISRSKAFVNRILDEMNVSPL